MSKATIQTSAQRQQVSDWVNQYGDQMFSWALHRTSDRAVACDLVQDTFLSALQHFSQFKKSSSPKTWLFAILQNKIRDHFRKSFRMPSVSLDSGNGFDLNWFDQHGQWKKEFRPRAWEMDENLLDDPDFNDVFAGCLSKLPGSWAACVQMKYMGRQETRDICQHLDIRPSNLWQMLHRAKLQLRNCLENFWFKR